MSLNKIRNNDIEKIYSDFNTYSTKFSLFHFRSASKGSGNNSSGHRSTSGSDITTGSGTSTNASSSEFSCDTVVYRGASGSGYSDGSGTDGEHPPMFHMRSAASSREGSLRGSLDEIPRPASAGSRRRKILTNGAISPRQCLSPSPRSPAGRAMSDCGGSRKYMLPAIPEVVSGDKMPLSGLVPIQSNHRYRQLCHINNLKKQQRSQKTNVIDIQRQREDNLDRRKSEEVWIDCDPTKNDQSEAQITKDNQQKSSIPVSTSKKRSSYGYMDSHKANMINSWVENQSSPVDTSHNSAKGERGSKESILAGSDNPRVDPRCTIPILNSNVTPDQPVFRALTQFKTIDTSDDGGGSSIMSLENRDQIIVQVHHSQHPMTTGGESPACVSYLEDDTKKISDNVSSKPVPPPPPPRTTSPRNFKLDDIVIDATFDKMQPIINTSHENLICAPKSDKIIISGDMNNGPCEDVLKEKVTSKDEEFLVNSKERKEMTLLENDQLKVRARKPPAQSMLYQDQRQSYHEGSLEENHPLRVLSESNLTVVSSFGGSLNDLNVEDCENGDEIATRLAQFKLPDMPQSSSSNFGLFDDSIIDQRFKEFERLHNQGNNIVLNANEQPNTQKIVSMATKAPLLSTFSSSHMERKGNGVADVCEYISLNDTRDSNISNLYCEPFIASMENGRMNSHNVERFPNLVGQTMEHTHKLPSPNFRYNLPSRSLQPDPDGSSNPEINLAGKDPYQPLSFPLANDGVDNQKGHAWNTSRLWGDNNRFYHVSKSMSCDNTDNMSIQSKRKSPNNNTSIEPEASTDVMDENDAEIEGNLETKASFGSRFLRLFGSKRKKDGKKRSKSCESGGNNFNKCKPGSGSSVAPIAQNPKVKFLVDSERNSRRSASASPDMLMTAGRKLSNRTNRGNVMQSQEMSYKAETYEFVKKLDLDSSSGCNSQNTTSSSDNKGVNNLGLYLDNSNVWGNGLEYAEESIETNFNHIIIQQHPKSVFHGGNSKPRNKHRKSSGYDSLDGDEESSSLDSAASNQNKIGLLNGKILEDQKDESSLEDKQDNQQNVLHHHNLNNKNVGKANTNKNSSGGVFKRLLSRNSSKTNNSNFTKSSIAEENMTSHQDIQTHLELNDEQKRKSFCSKNIRNSEMNRAHITKPVEMEIIQYDEVDIMRMDFRSKQTSSLASTTNDSHSSTYSSTHS